MTQTGKTGEEYREQFEKGRGIKPNIPTGTLYIPWLESRLSLAEQENRELRELNVGYRKQLIEWIEWAIKTLSEQRVDVSDLKKTLASLSTPNTGERTSE